MAEKSILEQALLQIETLEEAVKANAKGIISSTMKKELSELLKESKEEEDENWASQEEEAKASEEDDDESAIPDEEEENDMASDDEESDDDESDEEGEAADDTDLDNEPKGIDSLDADSDMDADADMDDYNADDEDDTDVDADNDVMDMTGASDDEVMKVFKAMKPEDGIVVKKDGGHLSVNDGDNEYIIKLDDESTPSHEEESEPFTDHTSDEEEEDESNLYEITLDEEDTDPTTPDTNLGEEEDEDEDDDDDHKVQADEAARTKSNPHGNKNGMHRAGLPSKKKYKAGSTINEEVETLKKQNGEYKKALVLFKDKLNEVAIFNANLAYFTRLVTEHSTTKQEKLNILKRFDSVSTMNESKNLFKTIEAELGSKKPVTESVVNKISATPTTSSSQETLTESKAYENPQFKRMKDLMSKIK
jgi:hypothetical protein